MNLKSGVTGYEAKWRVVTESDVSYALQIGSGQVAFNASVGQP